MSLENRIEDDKILYLSSKVSYLSKVIISQFFKRWFPGSTSIIIAYDENLQYVESIEILTLSSKVKINRFVKDAIFYKLKEYMLNISNSQFVTVEIDKETLIA